MEDIETFNGNETTTSLSDQLQEHQAILQAAVESGEISQKTFDTLNQHINYSDYDARQAMLAEGHNNFGMPVDENGEPEPTPMYIGSDGQEHPRVYHRGTKMWYDPEALDDFRNREGIGTYINRPHKVANAEGLRLGQDGNGANKFEATDNPDLYRLAIPSINNTTHGDPDGYDGVFISRTGVQKIGTVDNRPPPSMVNGELVNHGGENGDQPFSPEDIARQSFGLLWKNSNERRPDEFVDTEGNPANIIRMNAEGDVDGGWQEWLKKPVRKLFDRPDPALVQSKWRGPQTWSGREILKPEEQKPKMTRVQALQQYGTINVPQRINQALGRRPGEKRSAIRALWDSINMSLPRSADQERRGEYRLGPISQDAAINQYRDGQSDEQKRRLEAAENLNHAARRQRTEIDPATGKPYWSPDMEQQVEDYNEAQQRIDMAQNDPQLRQRGQYGSTTDPTENDPANPV